MTSHKGRRKTKKSVHLFLSVFHSAEQSSFSPYLHSSLADKMTYQAQIPLKKKEKENEVLRG